MENDDKDTAVIKNTLIPVKKVGYWCIVVNKLKNSDHYSTRENEKSKNKRKQYVPVNSNVRKIAIGNKRYYLLDKHRVTEFIQCDLIKYKPKPSQEQQKQLQQQQQQCCVICIESFNKKQKLIQLNCKHAFHSKCILQWTRTKKNCPLCQKKIDTVTFGEEKPPNDNMHNECNIGSSLGNMFTMSLYASAYGYAF